MFKFPDAEQFNLKVCLIAGDECVLVTPKDMGVVWTEQNKYFRSSIWRKRDMFPVSLGYRKFSNFGEQPDFEPWKENEYFTTVRKIDGSLLIVSKYKGKLIVRTRGTIDASILPNGFEIEILKKKYPLAFDNVWLNEETHSLLFEWTTPTNRIVLKESEEPTLSLIGIVTHANYKYMTQNSLNSVAKDIEVGRPEIYRNFRESKDLEAIREFNRTDKTIEGFVIYSGDGQILKKLKTEHYLYLHRVYTGIKTLNNLFDLWKDYNYPEREVFEEKLADEYDVELVSALQELMNQLFSRWKDLEARYLEIKRFTSLDAIQSLSRKEQASTLIEKYKNWSGIAFSCLDNKLISIDKLFKMEL